MQRLKDPLPHLRGSGEREGDGQNLFRLVHFGKQLQQASSQQLRLARTSGSLHQKGLASPSVCARALSSTGCNSSSVIVFIRLVAGVGGIVFGDPAKAGEIAKLTGLGILLRVDLRFAVKELLSQAA